MKNTGKIKKIVIVLAVLFVVGVLLVFGVNAYVLCSSRDNIISLEEASKKDYDAIVVLGAGLSGDKPSPMLQERLDKGIEVFENGSSKYIVMSGDHHKESHDEVNVMKNYAIDNNVPSDKIFMDHAGISTYDSIYRAKEIFGLEKILVVTQKYHLYRAIYIAKSLGIETDGVDAEVKKYSGNLKREIREVLARDKDVVKCLLKPTSSIMGEAVAVSGSGNITNDKPYVSIKNNNEEAFYSNDLSIVDKMQDIIDSYEFTSETCDGKADYTLEIGSQRYFIENYSKVHIVKDKKEIVLNEEDSLYLKDLIE